MRALLRLGPLLACAGVRLAAQQWTEQSVIEQFLNQNPIVRETQARLAIADAETRGRTLWANPTLGVSREGAGRTEFYQASQALPLSGRFPLLRQAGDLQAEALQAEGAYSLWTARCALRSAFYRALANQLRRQVWLDAGAELDRMIHILDLREKEGEGSRLDRLRAERERVELAASAQSAEAQFALERGLILGFLPPGTALDQLTGSLDAPAPPLSLAHCTAQALAHRPDLLSERRRIEQLRKEQAAADRLKYPEPIINAGFKRADLGLPSLANGPVLGVSLALPVFNKGKTEVARYSAEQQRVTARLDQLTRRAHAAIEAAWRAFEAHRAALVNYQQAAASTASLLKVTTLAYQEGEIGILQLLDAYRLARDSRLRELDLALAAKQARIALEAQLGEEFPQ